MAGQAAAVRTSQFVSMMQPVLAITIQDNSLVNCLNTLVEGRVHPKACSLRYSAVSADECI